ncbi:ashwin isoform X1 [Zootoca vivipara]|uniref:ashwin isoform X1 n=1 Tax=Zootoca vivipara TaxID=8524 RepID=UPI00293B9D46|nr:ashwin isoform X1 [Zootoca vivipara]
MFCGADGERASSCPFKPFSQAVARKLSVDCPLFTSPPSIFSAAALHAQELWVTGKKPSAERLRLPIRFAFGKMAALGSRERSTGEGGSGGARADSGLLLHPELLSQEFLLLTLEQKNIPVEDEVKISKDGLTDLYVQHVIPLPQRELPKTRWGKLMEKKRGQQVFKHEIKSTNHHQPPEKMSAKRKSYSVEFKKGIVEDSQGKNLTAFCKEKKLDIRMVQKWRAEYDNLRLQVVIGNAKKRKCGSGRQPLFPQLEDMIIEWIADRRAKALVVRRADIQAFALAMAPLFEISPEFKASQHWLDGFLQRYELSLGKINDTVYVGRC